MSSGSLPKLSFIEKYIDLAELFPRGRPDFRKKLTRYQVKKINQALNFVYAEFGDMPGKNFVPMGQGRKKYNEENSLPAWLRGISLPGGSAANKKLRYAGGAVRYERGGAVRARISLDNFSEETIISSAKKALRSRDGRKVYLTAAGKVITSVSGMPGVGGVGYEEEIFLIRDAVALFNKYAEMSANKEIRYRKDTNGKINSTIAAHPSEWKIGFLFEGENSKKKQTRKK